VASSERRRGFSASQQLEVVAPLVFVWAAGFSILAAVAVRGDVGELLLDPTYASGGAWYLGAVSQLGILAWTLGSGAAAAASWMAFKTGRIPAAKFLRAGSIAGAVLLLDDLFGVHSGPVAKLTGKSLGQALVLLPAVWWFVKYRSDILRTRWQVLLCALTGLALSVIIDLLLSPDRLDYAVLAEDGPKFLGVLAWATYWVMTGRDIVNSVLAETTATTSSSGATSPEEPRTKR
jgi:hypothetical protein